VDCVIARRQPDKPGSGIAFMSPVKGKKVQDAARSAGIVPAMSISTLRVEGSDKPGLGAKILRAIADVGVNLRGVSAAVVGNKFVAYFGFDNGDDAAKAAKAIKSVDAKKR
jgi:predicted amino acid-binding ACT domain protein